MQSNYLLITLFITLFNLILIQNLNRIKFFFNIYDNPDKIIKLHKKKTPILGGIILLLNYALLLLIEISIDRSLYINFTSNKETITFFFFIIFFFIVGIYDDKYLIKPENKLLFLFLISLLSILINDNLNIEIINVSFYEEKIFLKNFSFIFAIICILILTNSLNFFDGINGLSIINFIIVFLYLFIISNYNIFYYINILILIFLFYLNINGKIFLGDSGIYLFSAVLSFSLIYEYNVFNNFIYADEIFLMFCIPVFDLLRITIHRIINGKNAFFGDRQHIHHIISSKCSLFKTNFIIILLVISPMFSYHLIKVNLFLSNVLALIFYSTIYLIFVKR